MIIFLRGGFTVCAEQRMLFFVFILQILFLLENSGLVCVFFYVHLLFFFIRLRASSPGFCSFQVFYLLFVFIFLMS